MEDIERSLRRFTRGNMKGTLKVTKGKLTAIQRHKTKATQKSLVERC